MWPTVSFLFSSWLQFPFSAVHKQESIKMYFMHRIKPSCTFMVCALHYSSLYKSREREEEQVYMCHGISHSPINFLTYFSPTNLFSLPFTLSTLYLISPSYDIVWNLIKHPYLVSWVTSRGKFQLQVFLVACGIQLHRCDCYLTLPKRIEWVFRHLWTYSLVCILFRFEWNHVNLWTEHTG